jgi:HEPN domain-containing protein
MAITYHLLRDLDKARDWYKKAEKILQVAYTSIGDGDSDDEIDKMKQSYMRSLKRLLEYHLIAAEDAHAVSEAEGIRKLMKSVP